MSKLLIETQYFPCIEFFIQALQHDSIVLEAFENFQKQTYRNRCTFPGPNKLETLVVPVKHTSRHIPIKEVEVDYSSSWNKQHWRAIQTSYGRSPFYEYYAPELEGIFMQKRRFLWDINEEALTICLKLLKIKKDITYSADYLRVNEVSDDSFSDYRGRLKSGIPIESRHSASGYRYAQVFGVDFVPDCSVLDILFCEGPNAAAIFLAEIKQRKSLDSRL
jgi:hypothetical protein